jgi:hypothetical protein
MLAAMGFHLGYVMRGFQVTLLLFQQHCQHQAVCHFPQAVNQHRIGGLRLLGLQMTLIRQALIRFINQTEFMTHLPTSPIGGRLTFPV